MDQWVVHDGGKVLEPNRRNTETIHPWRKTQSDVPSTIIGDYVEHHCREHKREADHMANSGAERLTKVNVQGVKTTVAWKAVRGYWGGSKKESGSSGCGVVIRAVDRERWITVSNISALVKASTAVAAEVRGTYILTGGQDLMFGQSRMATHCNEIITDE